MLQHWQGQTALPTEAERTDANDAGALFYVLRPCSRLLFCLTRGGIANRASAACDWPWRHQARWRLHSSYGHPRKQTKSQQSQAARTRKLTPRVQHVLRLRAVCSLACQALHFRNAASLLKKLTLALHTAAFPTCIKRTCELILISIILIFVLLQDKDPDHAALLCHLSTAAAGQQAARSVQGMRTTRAVCNEHHKLLHSAFMCVCGPGWATHALAGRLPEESLEHPLHSGSASLAHCWSRKDCARKLAQSP